MRLQPRLGFYLDDAMRANNLPYFMHVLGGRDGIKDLAGNPLDFQEVGGTTFESLVIDFTLDTRDKQPRAAYLSQQLRRDGRASIRELRRG